MRLVLFPGLGADGRMHAGEGCPTEMTPPETASRFLRRSLEPYLRTSS